MEISREVLTAVADLWTIYLTQKVSAADVAVMLFLAGEEVSEA